MQEPDRKEDAAAEKRIGEPQAAPGAGFAAEPRAYAFDGWGMVPLELDPV